MDTLIRGTNSFHTADLILLVAYFVVMLFIGLYFSQKVKSVHEFFGGGSRVPWWLSGFSFYMTSFSAFAFVIYSQLAYKYGWTAITVSWMAIFGAILSARFFASRWRRAARTSPLEFVEKRFGEMMRQGLVWLNIPLRIIDNGLKLFVIGSLVSAVLGYGDDSILTFILFSGIIVFMYTVMGGLWAVVVTDFVQAIIMLVAIIVLLPLALYRVGGLHNLFDKAPDGFFNLTNETFTVGYLVAWVILLALNYSSSWSLVQRYYSVETDTDARKVGYLVAFLHFIVTPMMYLPAIAARVIYPDLSESQTEQIYGIICRDLLPVGMIGLLISGMFAATMSTLSGEYNAIASVMTNDVYLRYIDPQTSSGRLLLVGRVTTVIAGIFSIAVALVVWMNPEGRNLFDLMVKVFSIFLPPIAVPMLAGLVSRKVSNWGGLLGLILGIMTGLIAFILSQCFNNFSFLKDNQYMIPTTISASFLGIVIGSIWAPPSEKEAIKIDEFFRQMNMPSVTSTSTPQQSDNKISPFYVIGVSVGVLGLILSTLILILIPTREGWLSLCVGFSLMIFGSLFWMIDRKKNHQ